MDKPEWVDEGDGLTRGFMNPNPYCDGADCTICGKPFPLLWTAGKRRRPWGTSDGQPVCRDCRGGESVPVETSPRTWVEAPLTEGVVGPLCTRCYQAYPESEYKHNFTLATRWGSRDKSIFHHHCIACRTRPRNPDRPTQTTCQRCGESVPMKRKGPTPKFCSSRCRVADFRERQASNA
jgi:endogenous inhibitor of DNA gyrase (YacG/DUF329 family)